MQFVETIAAKRVAWEFEFKVIFKGLDGFIVVMRIRMNPNVMLYIFCVIIIIIYKM